MNQPRQTRLRQQRNVIGPAAPELTSSRDLERNRDKRGINSCGVHGKARTRNSISQPQQLKSKYQDPQNGRIPPLLRRRRSETSMSSAPTRDQQRLTEAAQHFQTIKISLSSASKWRSRMALTAKVLIWRSRGTKGFGSSESRTIRLRQQGREVSLTRQCMQPG